ncbi:MAG: hypothetical protein KAT34_11690 [Candidatus Aminicenantes bacterium]|nr:hypothetical protein [Candidatus Aminicenantes bacterium]
MLKKIFLLFLILNIAVYYTNAQEAVIIDHTCTDISQIPDYWIQQAKANLRIGYGHTSHGSQLATGIETFRGNPGSLYYYTYSGWGLVPGVFLNDYWGNAGGAADLGHNGDLGWRDAAITMLNLPDNDRNVVIWSWCGGVSDNTVAGINTYLNAMNQLEQAYPGVTFIYMTGHLDGSGTAGNLHLRNEQIRAYCIANNKILFDFADIESYDPDGNGFLGRGADDDCYYYGGNWADEWIAANPGSELAQLASACGSCAHSRRLNCVLKGRAFWWMMARVAGWEGGAGPAISITSPYAGRTYGIGRPLPVGWTSSGITGTIKIGLIGSDSTNRYLIARSVPYNGSPYNYIIPPNVIPGSYFVKIKQGTLTARSAAFNVGRITVHAPLRGESYSTGDSLSVGWTAEGITGNVKIGIIRTDKSRRYLITASTPYDNSPYIYTIPAGILPGTYVAVVKKEKAYGISGKFTINF